MKAAIFDMDGTLVDSVDLHAKAWQEALRHFGRNVTFEEVRAQIGKGGDQIVPYFLPPDAVERIGEQLQDYRKQVFQRNYLPQVGPFPKVRELFERIHAHGAKCALATSAPKDELEHNKRLVHIEDLVDAESTADDAEKSKPHPDIFHAVLEALRPIAARDSVAIGDSPYDAEAAERAGIRAIGFRSGGFPDEALLGAGCIALYDGPWDLLDRFDSSIFAKD